MSNTFGAASLTVGTASIGAVLDGAQLAPGAQVLSDPLRMAVQPLEELAVSLYLPEATGQVTQHSDA